MFGDALDLVVQLDRDDLPRGTEARIRRQVMEITAVAPTLADDRTYEPIFVRKALGRPLEWTGVLPGRARTTHRPGPPRRACGSRALLEGRKAAAS